MVVLLFAKCGTQNVDGLAPVHGSLLTECACKNDLNVHRRAMLPRRAQGNHARGHSWRMNFSVLLRCAHLRISQATPVESDTITDAGRRSPVSKLPVG